ncbi:BaeS Signal transduction histidine kinase [Candidatus Nanopelagicaceae bacterium]
MKLSSTARLRLVTLATATILTASIGSFITVQSYQNALSTIDTAITSTIDDAAKSPNQELSAALFHLDEFSLDLSLYLVSRDGAVTTVSESTIQLFEEISLRKVAGATNRVEEGRGVHDYRFRSYEISGGDYLVVAGSSVEANSRLKSGLITVFLITILTSLLAFGLLSIYIRRLKRRDDEDALARMQAFLGDASHELRTPLTVIKGYVEMLSKGLMNEEADKNRAFSRVNTEIGRMETLIHDLLLLAELGESAQRESELIDLSELLTSHGEDFATLNPDRKVTLAIASDIRISGVRDYFSRFIQNALNNISRHTEGEVEVSISLTKIGKRAILTIEDGGAGLPESAYREKIQSLNRFDKSRSRESGGSGLGMSIMAAVIAKSDGELSLRKSHLGGLAVIADIPTYRE